MKLYIILTVIIYLYYRCTTSITTIINTFQPWMSQKLPLKDLIKTNILQQTIIEI